MTSLSVKGDTNYTASHLDPITVVNLNVENANATFRGIVSDEIRDFFMVMNFVILCGFLTVFGSVTNLINIIVFIKLGFKDPVNISLLALALSDFGCCFSLIWLTICYNPLFQKLDNLPFDPADFHYLTSGWIHNTFTRITVCITAFITFERCLCVVIPLKVKAIITPKRVTIFLACVVLFVLACIAPVFYTARYEWKFHPGKNRSILSLVFIENAEEVDNVAFAIHGIFLPITAFFVVLVSTIALVINLRQKSKWRESVTSSSSSSSTSSSATNNLSSRDAKVSKMVVMVATLFIACFIPVFISYLAIMTEPGYNIKGRFENVFLIMFSYHFALETLNSSMNIFIYHRMSSNYRSVFNQLFRVRREPSMSEVKATT